MDEHTSTVSGYYLRYELDADIVKGLLVDRSEAEIATFVSHELSAYADAIARQIVTDRANSTGPFAV